MKLSEKTLIAPLMIKTLSMHLHPRKPKYTYISGHYTTLDAICILEGEEEGGGLCAQFSGAFGERLGT